MTDGGTVDLSDMVGEGVFTVWEDPAEFAKVGIDPVTHMLAWPGGIDLCPDSLYEGSPAAAGGCVRCPRRCCDSGARTFQAFR